jgi:hypothetical protein
LKEGLGTKKTFFEFKFLFLLGEKERSSLQSFLPDREKEKKRGTAFRSNFTSPKHYQTYFGNSIIILKLKGYVPMATF